MAQSESRVDGVAVADDDSTPGPRRRRSAASNSTCATSRSSASQAALPQAGLGESSLLLVRQAASQDARVSRPLAGSASRSYTSRSRSR